MFVRCLPNSKGFTFVELIATLLIMAIAGSVILSRTSSAQGFQASAEFDRIKTHLRFAQRKTLKANPRWGIQFDSPTSYWLFQESTANKRRLPDVESLGVTLTALKITNAPLTVLFDGIGSPGANPLRIATSKGDIVVQGGTGFVE